MVPRIFAWARGPAATSTDEARCSPIKSLNWVHAYRDCNRNMKPCRIYKAVLETIKVVARNHRGQPILSIIEQILDVGLLLHERA
jgi:hypothetical protein